MMMHRRPIRFMRRLWRDESGQSSFFAALTLFLLVAGIGYSYNVSLVVSRRVRLQNAADAAAMSAAAVEANALSAIAWLNGCETYIHARMQEIMLDIPYTATAAATAEWGRYIMDRYGTGDLKKNPVEMNHNTNKIGFVGGLWNQIKDLLGGLGGIFESLGPSGDVDDDLKEELQGLLDEYFDPSTKPERKTVVEKILKDKFGLDLSSSKYTSEAMEKALQRVDAAQKAYEAAKADFINTATAFDRGYRNKDFGACDIAKTYRDKMLTAGSNILGGLLEQKKVKEYKGDYSYKTHHDNIVINLTYISERLPVVNKAITNTQNSIEYYNAIIKDPKASDSSKALARAQLDSLDAKLEELTKEKEQLDACQAALPALRDEANLLHNKAMILDAATEELRKATEELEEISKKINEDSVKQDREAAEEKRKELLEQWENDRKNQTQETEYDIERSMFFNSYNDPPEPWALFKMVPVPLLNPYGPNMHFGRMSPLGTALSDVGIGGDYSEEDGIERDAKLEDAIKEWAKDKSLKSGMPPWDELKTAFAGPFGKYLWPDLMRIRYSLESAPDSMDDFLDFFHNTLVKEGRRWIGYRRQSGKSFVNEGIRPGEQWIRQLSQIAAAIASAMPKLVRNEVVYSVAVNASVKTTVAIFPDPDDLGKWGDVAFAKTDALAGEKFFRYDGWFAPPDDKDLKRNWMPPPPYVNMYTFANSLAPSIREAVKFNNKAVWKEDGLLYGNRFLNESRRQNLRMRTESVGQVGADKIKNLINEKLSGIHKMVPGIVSKFFNVNGLLQGVADRIIEMFPILEEPFPSLSYVALADDEDRVGSDAKGPLGYFRMNREKSFYWDEYNGRVGGWRETDGPGAPVRVAVKCWNQNDRLWRQPKKDAENNNKLLIGMFDGLANMFTMVPVTLPVPFASSHYSFNNGLENMFSKSQVNFNLNPRCQTGYAPGSNVFGLGHPLFVPAHGDPNDAFGAADGHWHFMHYHSHSRSCQVGFPGIGLCTSMVNCIIMGIIDFFIKGAIKIGDDMGPVDRRVGWDSTMHFPYKHWDGTIADDGSTMFVGKEVEAKEAKKYHIYCRVATSNNFKEKYTIWNTISKVLGHGEERQPPFTIPLSSDIGTGIMQLVPPLALYAAVDPCPKIHIYLIVVDITICTHLLTHLSNYGGDGMNPGLHGHVTCKDGIWKNIIPKDAIPIYNTPVLWNWGDSDPSIISMWGAQLSTGDMEGDFFMGLGSGDRFFYPELLYRFSGILGNFLPSDKGRFATGRPRILTQMNNPADWALEVLGVGVNAVDESANVMKNFDFLSGPAGIMGDLSSNANKLLAVVGKMIGNVTNLFGGNMNLTRETQRLKSSADMYKTGSIFHEVFTTVVDLLTRWGHHRFMTCPLCMSYCPLGCDFHDGESGYPIRHWGGDYGGADAFDLLPARGSNFDGIAGTYYKALGFMSILPGMLATGDQKSDAGMTYANVLRGHDYSPKKVNDSNKHWYGRNGDDTKKDKIPYGNSYFDLGVDLDDGLAGNGGGDRSLMTGREMTDGTGRAWTNSFPMDRFVREWMTPIPAGSTVPDTRLAPTVVVTENFMRHGITVAVIERYTPILWMFGKTRPLVAVATAKCGFIERPDVYVGDTLVTIDGIGAGSNAAPQIVAGIGEKDGGAGSGAQSRWTLDTLWDNFLDFPNKRPLGESNLYYGNWGAKMIPTRYGILANAVVNRNNARRNVANQIADPEEAHRRMWAGLGRATCYRGDGKRHVTRTTLALQCGMSQNEWDEFAVHVVDFSRQAANTMTR